MPHQDEIQFKLKEEIISIEVPRRASLDKIDPYPRVRSSPPSSVPPENIFVEYAPGDHVAIYIDPGLLDKLFLEQLKYCLDFLHRSGAYAQEIRIVFSRKVDPREVPSTIPYSYDCKFLSAYEGEISESGRTPEGMPLSYLNVFEGKFDSIYVLASGGLDPIFGVKTAISSLFELLSKESFNWLLNYRATTDFRKVMEVVNSCRDYLPFFKVRGGLIYFQDLGLLSPSYSFFYGDLTAVHEEVIAHAKETYYFDVPVGYDIGIFGITSGDPEGIYRALSFNPSLVKEGGTIIFYSPEWEISEEFEERMVKVMSSKRMESITSEEDLLAHEMGKSLVKYDIIFVGEGSTSIFESSSSIQDAIDVAMRKEGKRRGTRIALLPYADYTFTRWERWRSESFRRRSGKSIVRGTGRGE